MKNKYLIFVFERRHGYLHDYEHFAMEYFEKRGYTVLVWSVVDWTFGEKISTPKNIDLSGRTTHINGKKEFEDKVKEFKGLNCKFLIYPYHAYGKVSFEIRKIIRKYRFEFCNLTENSDLVEVKELKLETCKDVSKYYLELLEKKLKKDSKKEEDCNDVNQIVVKDNSISLIHGLLGPILYKSKYNFCVTENQYNYFPNKFEVLSKRNVMITHSDYGKYLKIKQKEKLYTEEYIVFIDEYECGHSDFEKMGLPYAIQDSVKYYKELNDFFDYVEKIYRIPIVIAAHPKAEYESGTFGKRKIEYFKTADLIRDAKLVLYMYGTSLSYILLFKKNFLHVYTSQHMRGHVVDEFINGVQRRLNTRLLRTDCFENEIDICSFMKAYCDEYEKFISMYLKSNTGVDEAWYETIARYLEQGDN